MRATAEEQGLVAPDYGSSDGSGCDGEGETSEASSDLGAESDGGGGGGDDLGGSRHLGPDTDGTEAGGTNADGWDDDGSGGGESGWQREDKTMPLCVVEDFLAAAHDGMGGVVGAILDASELGEALAAGSGELTGA